MMKVFTASSFCLAIFFFTSVPARAQLGPSSFEDDLAPPIARIDTPYGKVVYDTASMIGDARAQFHAAKYGLDIINLTWEDTGRFEDSAVGPNISDVTIQVQQQDPQTKKHVLTCMPVIRFPNFTDRTADIPLEKFKLVVGNHSKGQPPTTITLRELLEDPTLYMSKPDSWKGKKPKTLLAPRDSHALVSAQACFLPIPKQGIAEFNPVIFNYQSVQEDPAVLTFLATREGTSMTIIDNVRDGFEAGYSWGQRLFFNHEGQRAVLTGQRKSDFKEANADRGVKAGSESGLNLVMLIQVPLKQKNPQLGFGGGLGGSGFGGGGFGGAAPEGEALLSDVEQAVIGHGEVEGPFTEVDDLEIRRDPKYPIRITVQFYQATSNGVVSEQDMEILGGQIHRVYEDADFVGSLVVGGPSDRPTEFDGPKLEPPTWWEDFWQRHEKNTGQDRVDALQMLRQTLGPHWHPESQGELQQAMNQAKQDSTN